MLGRGLTSIEHKSESMLMSLENALGNQKHMI